MKKILTIMSVGMFVLVLSGCGHKNPPVETPMVSPQGGMEEEDNNMENIEAMPEATGDVDATVDAIISGANSEGSQVTNTDADAISAIGDGEDINNLNNIYDEDAL